jgi:hypothetical protein
MNPKTGMDIPRFPAFPQDRIEVWAATVTLGGAKRWSRVDLAIFAGIWTSISPCYPRVLVGVIFTRYERPTLAFFGVRLRPRSRWAGSKLFRPTSALRYGGGAVCGCRKTTRGGPRRPSMIRPVRRSRATSLNRYHGRAPATAEFGRDRTGEAPASRALSAGTRLDLTNNGARRDFVSRPRPVVTHCPRTDARNLYAPISPSCRPASPIGARIPRPPRSRSAY